MAADLEMGGTVELPQGCPSRRDKPCAGKNFRHCSEVSLFTNYQEVRVQEAARCLMMGGLPRAITVLLQDELADRCRVGGAPAGRGCGATRVLYFSFLPACPLPCWCA